MRETIILLCILLFLISGCESLGFTPFGIGKTKVITAPKPAEQLWHTVKKSNWTITLAIPIIALGAVAAFNGMMKLGMSAIIFGSVNLFMGLATARFAIWMAVFGLIGSAVAVAASVLFKNRALQELIRGGQSFKDEVVAHEEDPDSSKWGEWDSVKECFNANQAVVQTKNTKKLVKKIKTKLNGG